MVGQALMHRCPGYALNDCPDRALVPDEPEDVDRCPKCNERNKRWETDLRIRGQSIIHTKVETVYDVFIAMKRTPDA